MREESWFCSANLDPYKISSTLNSMLNYIYFRIVMKQKSTDVMSLVMAQTFDECE